MIPTEFTLTEFSLAEAGTVLQPLAFFVLAMAVYAVFVFKFYRLLATKDIFDLGVSHYDMDTFSLRRKTWVVGLYVSKYLILFPVFAFFWFVVLAALLAFLAKDRSLEDVLLISMAVVGAIRISAYYNEDLSKDLAKILPFALLGIFLVDSSYFSLSASLNALQEAVVSINVLAYYLMVVLALEFVLRMDSALLRTNARDTGPGLGRPAESVASARMRAPLDDT